MTEIMGIATHVNTKEHDIDWNNAKIIYEHKYWYGRKVVEVYTMSGCILHGSQFNSHSNTCAILYFVH